MIDIISLLQTLGGIAGGLGLGMFTKSGRIKSQADAFKMMAEAYEFRIKALHEVVETCNKTIKELQDRIAELNHALNEKEDEIQDKKGQIRNLTDKVWQSEQEVNRVNGVLNDAKDEIIRLTEERDYWKSCNEYNKGWRCIKSTCKDPDGRIPPNTTLATQEYNDPEKR